MPGAPVGGELVLLHMQVVIMTIEYRIKYLSQKSGEKKKKNKNKRIKDTVRLRKRLKLVY